MNKFQLTLKETEILESFLTRFRTKKSKDNYKRTLQRFRSYLNKSFMEAKEEDCRYYIENIEEIYENPPSAKTKESIYSSLYSFYNYMLKNNRIEYNPFNNVKKPLTTRSLKKEATMNSEEINKFIEAALKENPRDKALALLFLTTGIKTGEAIRIKWDHFSRDNLNNIGLYIENPINEESSRTIKIIDDVWECLLDYRESIGKDRTVPLDDFDYVFLNQNGKPISSSWALKVIKSISKKAGLKKEYTPSALRHTLAKYILMSNWVNKGDKELEEQLQQAMGWSQKHLARNYDGVIYELEEAPVNNLYFKFKKDEGNKK